MFLYYSLFVALIVIADQVAKYFTVLYIPAAGAQPFIPGILQITYVRNTGAAFSSFEGQQWLFALIFLVLTGLIFWEYFKKPMGFTKLERFCIAAIYGGGLGNMIDRCGWGMWWTCWKPPSWTFPCSTWPTASSPAAAPC